jgi:polar amino acid transport system substrate-binding protein
MRIFKVLFIMVLVAFFATSSYGQDRKILIVGEDWLPFEFLEENVAKGIDVDLATVIFKNLNVQFEVKILPWARAWKMIEDGDADACLSTSRKPEREPYLYYPNENMWVSEYVFFVRKDKFQEKFNGYQDAKAQNLKIGVVRGNSYNSDFWAAFPNVSDGVLNPQLEEVKDPDLNFKKLIKGRIDLYIIDKTIGRYTLSKVEFSDTITYYPKPLFSKGYPMAFAKKSSYPNIKELVDKFDAELLKLKQSGEYDLIMEKWLK